MKFKISKRKATKRGAIPSIRVITKEHEIYSTYEKVKEKSKHKTDSREFREEVEREQKRRGVSV